MVKPKRAFHNINTVSVDLDVNIPELKIDPQPVQVPSSVPAAPRELRALDPLIHSSQASAVPQLPHERQLAQSAITQEFRTVEDATPPLADTRYSIVDQGIADPHVLRLSMYNIPSSKALRERTGLPLALVSRPFAAEIESLDFSHLPDVPRCGRCRAFVNPGVQFAQGGDVFVCNLCHFTTKTPDWYYEPTDHTGQRTVRGPELSCGTYDIKLPIVYSQDTAGSGPPRYVFLIDVTRDSLNKGIPSASATAILEVLYAQTALPETSKVAIATFSSNLHLYRMAGQEFEMLVQADIADPIIPPDVFFDPYEHQEQVESLLTQLPVLFKENWEPKSCLGSAVKASLEALGGSGGRVILIAATMPSEEPGRLERRDSHTYSAASAHSLPEPQLFATPSKFYRELADQFAAQGAGCDLFIFPTGYTDLSTLGLLPKTSGGRLYSYPRYVAQRDARAFMANLVDTCSSRLFRNCTVKVRTCLGLRTVHYWGIKPETTSGIMDDQSCFAVDFGYEGGASMDPRHDAYFQVAVMYTATDGSRHLRVSNTPAGITDQFKNVLKFVDSDACIGVMTRQALSQLAHVPVEELRKGVLQKVYQIFGACRVYAGGPLPPSQLLMPTALRCLLPYCNALLKSVALTGNAFSVDSRFTNAFHLSTATPDNLSLLLYPRVYSIEQLFEFEGDDFVTLEMLNASRAELSSCCIVFDGQTIEVWVSEQVSQQLLIDLFGKHELSEISAYWDAIPVLKTEINQKTRALVEWLAAWVGRHWVPLHICRQELDGSEYLVYNQLVDDPQGPGLPPYSEFLSNVHTQAKREAGRIETSKNWL